MPPSRAIMDGEDAPVARSYSPGVLTRRTPDASGALPLCDKKRRLMKLRRRQEEDEDEEDEEDESGSDSSISECTSEEGTSSSSEASGAESTEESPQELTPAQERLRAASPFADFEVPTVPNLGPLPMPPLNTRRSMRLDKIKRRSRRSLSRRQEEEESESESSDSSGDGLSGEEESSESESEDEADDAAITSTLNPGSVATITGGASEATVVTLDQSTFIAAADPTAAPTPASDTVPTDSASQESGPAPESRTAIIAGTTILGVALVVTLIYLLFRFCVPVRTWWTTRKEKHRDEKANRLGTAPSAWKWPLQFIFGSDRPAPPRRKPQQQHAPAEYYDKDAFGSDLESQAPNTRSVDSWPVADGFRPGTQAPPDYKSYTTTSGTSWVANGWRAPISHISERLSNWPRGSGTARWFFGGGAASASRWSDSDAGDGARTTYSEGRLVSMYGHGTSPPNTAGLPRRSSIAKSPLQQSHVQVSEVEVTPPMPTYSASGTKTTVLESPPNSGGLALTQTPVRARASPRNTYMTRSSVATTATTQSTADARAAFFDTDSLPPVPNVPYANYSHFSTTTVDPTTPRNFASGLPSMYNDVPQMPPVAASRRNSGARFPVRTSSVSSVSSRGSRSSGLSNTVSSTAPTTVTRASDKDKPLPAVGLSRGSNPQMI